MVILKTVIIKIGDKAYMVKLKLLKK